MMLGQATNALHHYDQGTTQILAHSGTDPAMIWLRSGRTCAKFGPNQSPIRARVCSSPGSLFSLDREISRSLWIPFIGTVLPKYLQTVFPLNFQLQVNASLHPGRNINHVYFCLVNTTISSLNGSYLDI